MSVHAISWVLRHSESTGSDRLVLIVLADHASGNGTNAYPAVDTIASEARVSRRTAQSSLRRLEGAGRITRTGPGPRGVSRYDVLMGGAESAPPGGAGHDTEGAQSTARGGAEVAPKPSKEPSKEPSNNGSGSSREQTVFDHWCRVFGKNGRTVLGEKRLRKIRAGLRHFTVEELCRAIDRARQDPWITGEHRDSPGYGLATILRDEEQIERFLVPSRRGATRQEMDF